MSAAAIPEDIIERLTTLHTECPGCHGDLLAEPDERMRTGLAWFCPNTSCSEFDRSCWIVTEGDIRKASR